MKIASVITAATTGCVVKQEMNIQIEEKAIPNNKRPNKFAKISPMSIEPPASSESDMPAISDKIRQRKATIAKNFPMMICVMDIGAETNKAIV